ncbi:MAG: TRAP transporter substrate-binding protein DctP [Arenimonas sp.]
MKRFLAFVFALCLTCQVQAQQIIKIATLAPDGSSWMRELRVAAKEIEATTQGRVVIKFYPGGVQGPDAVVIRKIRLGQLQGGVLTSSELASVYPDAPIYSMPFLFDDWAQVDRARIQIDPLLAKGFEAKGYKMLGASGIGFAYMMGTKPIKTRSEISGIKLWIPPNDIIAERVFKQGGITPIPLPLGDVFTSLQTGLIDTVANTPSGAVALQWHGKVRSMVDLPMSFVVGYLVLDIKAYNKLSPADQATVSKIFGTAAKRMDANIKRDDAAALAAMKKQGLVITKLDPAESARWRNIGAQVTTQLEKEKIISGEMLNAVRKAAAGAK